MKFHLMFSTVHKTGYGDMELVSLSTDTAKTNKGRCSGRAAASAAGVTRWTAAPHKQ
jgi:hypothetical protein